MQTIVKANIEFELLVKDITNNYQSKRLIVFDHKKQHQNFLVNFLLLQTRADTESLTLTLTPEFCAEIFENSIFSNLF